MRLRSPLFASAIAAALLLAGCGGDAGDTGGERFTRGIGSQPKSIDPQKVEGTWANDVIGDMFIGLFTEDAKSLPVPGVAESWLVSDDGLTWTFKLKHTLWSDGEPLTAGDFVFAFQRLFDPKEAEIAYASIQYGIKNGRASKEGAVPVTDVGVKAIDDYTLEIKLEYPMPYLPGVLKHYTAFPLPKHAIEKFGPKWTNPENIVVNGPYKIAEMRQNDFIRSERNDKFEGADKMCFKEVIYLPVNDHDAMVRRAMAGEIDMNNSFPSGQLEVTQKNLPGWPRISPMMATTYVVTNTKKPPFDDARVRKAIALAMDREHITKNVLRGGQIPAYSFVPAAIANYTPAEFDWKDMPRADRLKQAAALLQEAGYGPNKPLTFEYLYRSTGDNPRIAPVLQQNFKEIAPWVQPEIRRVETQALYDMQKAKNFIITDTGWVADFNDAYNFLYLLDSRTGPMNYGQYTNPAYDALLDQSSKEADVAKRGEILHQAEATMLGDTAVLPLLIRVTQDIVSPTITGYEDNPEDIHRTRYMCRKK
ncbi:MAG: peptide ABC transporter substrate-binding protein [Hyphomonadaceae bacterium]